MIGRDIGASGQIASERRRAAKCCVTCSFWEVLLTHHASLATATSHRLRTALTSPLTSRTTTTS